MSNRRRRVPTEEELRLWEKVAETVAPLARQPKLKPEAEPEATPQAKVAKGEAARPPPPKKPPKAPAGPAPPSLAPIDRRTRSRIVRGAFEIDARIDLHGMTQAAAHDRLLGFLRKAQVEGFRFVLVITGKGKIALDPADRAKDRGVLRRAVPLWLASAEFRRLVVGFEEAGRGHGGAGALYVRIRREKQPAL